MSKLVIFDCDGVLVDTEAIIRRTRVVLLRALDIPAIEEDLIPMSGLSAPDSYASIAARYNVSLPDDIRERFRIEFDRQIHQGIPSIPGVTELIDSLAVPFCVASNGGHRFMKTTLGAAQLYDKFSGHIFSAEGLPRPKPFPDIYLHAAEQMGVQSGECIVIEDSIHGVTAGSSAGMEVIGFIGSGHQTRETLVAAGAYTACTDMGEIASELKSCGLLK